MVSKIFFISMYTGSDAKRHTKPIMKMYTCLCLPQNHSHGQASANLTWVLPASLRMLVCWFPAVRLGVYMCSWEQGFTLLMPAHCANSPGDSSFIQHHHAWLPHVSDLYFNYINLIIFTTCLFHNSLYALSWGKMLILFVWVSLPGILFYS